VLVAELTGGNRICLYAEFCFRSIAGVEELDVGYAVGQEFDPLDIMVIGHGMGHGTDLYLITVFRLFNGGNMLFGCPVGSTFTEELHGFTAADEGGGSAVKDFNNISTMFALIYFKSCRHDDFSW